MLYNLYVCFLSTIEKFPILVASVIVKANDAVSVTVEVHLVISVSFAHKIVYFRCIYLSQDYRVIII